MGKKSYEKCPLNMNAFHLALLLWLREDPALMEEIPSEFAEEEFGRLYNKFCGKFSQIVPKCRESGYFGMYEYLWPGCGIEVPCTRYEFKKLCSNVGDSKKLARHRQKDVKFVFEDNFSRWHVESRGGRRDLSRLHDGGAVDLRWREGDPIFTSYVYFYGQRRIADYMSNIAKYDIAQPLITSIKFAFEQ